LGKGGGAEEAPRTGVRCAWCKFNEVASMVTMRVSLRLKETIYRARVFKVFSCMTVRPWAYKIGRDLKYYVEMDVWCAMEG